MSNPNSRNGDIEKLHPAIRDKVKAIRDQLNKENIPFEVFEAFRTPERQADLWAQGRTKPGNKVTWVGPWKSIHQYGLAVDFVLKPGGKWSWDTSGANAKHWTRMHELAKQNGMTPLFNSKGKLIELPHIQLQNLSTSALYAGNYPPGDEVWAEFLADMIDGWSGDIPPPPKPALAPERPPLPAEDVADMEDQAIAAGLMPATAKAPVPLTAAEDDARFARLHAFVIQWEGGFVNHPKDKGGPTNMGITQKTLADWRKTEVSVADVQNLTRAEADAIFRANYYSVCRCAEMPERTAMVVYNGAVLHGPARSIKLLQQAFNALGLTVDGKPLEVDGIIGRNTIAVAQQTSSAALSDAYMDQEEALFRSLDTFSTFGTGWLNRLAALREFVHDLPEGAGVAPNAVMKIEDTTSKLGTAVTEALGVDKRELANSLLALALADRPGSTEEELKRKALLRAALGTIRPDLAAPVPGTLSVDVKPPLTPVNAALGEGIGRMLDGKKSVIGIVGLLVTAIAPALGLTGVGAPATILSFLANNSEQLMTIFSIVTGWGFLGKIDKAIEKKTLL